MQHPETQIPTSQPHPMPQETPLSKRQSQCDCAENCRSHKTVRLRSELILHTSPSYASTRFLAISHKSDTSRSHAKPSPKPSPNGSGLSVLLRSAANGCGRLRTLRPRVANKALPPDPLTTLRYTFGKKEYGALWTLLAPPEPPMWVNTHRASPHKIILPDYSFFEPANSSPPVPKHRIVGKQTASQAILTHPLDSAGSSSDVLPRTGVG